MRVVADPAAYEPHEPELARRASGYGCIRCGCTIVRYCEVVGDPNLFLMCPPCIAVLDAMVDRDRVLAHLRTYPLARQERFDRRTLPYMDAFTVPDSHFPRGVVMRQTVSPIVFAGAPVFSLEQPEAYGGAVRLTVRLGVGGDAPVTVVRQNVWATLDARWRFRHRPGRYLFEHSGAEAALVLAFPGDGSIHVESLRSRVGGQTFKIDAAGTLLDGRDFALPSSELQLVGVTLPGR